MSLRWFLVSLLAVLGAARAAHAQERPYFVTYDHYLEEPGNVEIAVANTTGVPRAEHAAYNAPWLEIEYGAAGWWTTELYLEGVTAGQDGSGFSGWRFENRFRLFKSEHRLNPVLYLEFEHVNEASRIQKEIVGSGALPFEPIDALRRDYANELEAKLILSSAIHGWNLSENVIFEKNLSESEGIEYGYSVGASRSLGGLASGRTCHVCAENFAIGVEAYGGLGSSLERTLSDTRHFIAPVLAWHVTPRSTLKVSPAFGLTDTSDRYLMRVGFVYELPMRWRR